MSLKRVLGVTDAGWIVAGSMIGAGIFIMPGQVAGRLPGLFWPLAAWALGGVVSLCGAAVYGELGARLPRAGGDYQYLTHAFGPFWGFLTAWAAFLLTFSAAAAVMTITALDYLTKVVPWPAAVPTRLAAPAVVLVLTLANTVGARVAGRTTTLLTVVPLAGLIVMFAAGPWIGDAEIVRPAASHGPSGGWALALSAAMIPVFYTYSGWNQAAYLAGEIRDPGRNLARALLGGTLLVTAVYLLINLVLLLVVPQEVLGGSWTAGAEAARRLAGPRAERVLSLIIATAVLGSVNVTLMAGARIYYAVARDGLGPRLLARTNAAGVPSGALWVGGLWTSLLATSATVELLLDWATLAILALSSLAVVSLFVLRRRDVGKPEYLCPGYPLTPVIYLVVSLGVSAAAAYDDPTRSLYGLLLVASGLPVWLIARRFRRV